MNIFRLLIVEDNDQDLNTCTTSVQRYSEQKERPIDYVSCKTASEAVQELNSSFDGAIIDLKLAAEGDEGNLIVRRINELNYRIPIAIFTGTPDNADHNFAYVGIFKKGETTYETILDSFWDIHNTGLTRIMGGRGILESTLSNVFQKNLLPRRNAWVKYGAENSARTEKALLRYSLNCLLQLLDDTNESCFPEEVFIFPPMTTGLQTGSIVRRKEDDKRFVVLNPACDLVIRKGGKFKTDRVLLGEIESYEALSTTRSIQISKHQKQRKLIEKCDHHNSESAAYQLCLLNHNDSLNRSTMGYLGNSQCLYFHWLPITEYFSGGFLNFRKLSSYTVEEFDLAFTPPEIQISPSFVKDIISRFSSFYARQGQPEIDHSAMLAALSE